MDIYSDTRGVHVHLVHPGWIRPCYKAICPYVCILHVSYRGILKHLSMLGPDIVYVGIPDWDHWMHTGPMTYDILFYTLFRSKKISNDQELIQSDPISCPQNQKGK